MSIRLENPAFHYHIFSGQSSQSAYENVWVRTQNAINQEAYSYGMHDQFLYKKYSSWELNILFFGETNSG